MCADGQLLTQLTIGKDLNGGGGRLLDQSGSYELLRGDLCETLLLRQERERSLRLTISYSRRLGELKPTFGRRRCRGF